MSKKVIDAYRQAIDFSISLEGDECLKFLRLFRNSDFIAIQEQFPSFDLSIVDNLVLADIKAVVKEPPIKGLPIIDRSQI